MKNASDILDNLSYQRLANTDNANSKLGALASSVLGVWDASQPSNWQLWVSVLSL
jgi:hypothetical protein